MPAPHEAADHGASPLEGSNNPLAVSTSPRSDDDGGGLAVPLLVGSGETSPRAEGSTSGVMHGLLLPQMDVDFEDQSLNNSQYTSFELKNSTGKLGRVIHDHLYVGGVKDVSSEDDCEALGIRAYLCVAGEISVPKPTHVSQAAIDSGECAFEHLPLTDDDCTRIRDHVARVFEFIDRNAAAGRPVLIYCQQGKSRSVSFAVAYMMRERCLTADAALAALRNRYRRAEPNIAFMIQLKAMEAELIHQGYERRGEVPPPEVPATTTGAAAAARQAEAQAFFLGPAATATP
jgi:protein tyrosine phosphatase (PTP) superfamily phosphohydrolase (DUF442 family)